MWDVDQREVDSILTDHIAPSQKGLILDIIFFLLSALRCHVHDVPEHLLSPRGPQPPQPQRRLLPSQATPVLTRRVLIAQFTALYT